MKVLLTSASSRVKAGVETYNDHLRKVFRDLKIIDFDSVNGFTSPLLREPLKAKHVDEYLIKKANYYKPDIIFTNGMYGWALKSLNIPVVNIQHGGYHPFAEAAMKISLDYFRTKYIYSYFEKLSAKKSDIVVSNSPFTRNNIKKYYGLDTVVILNCIDMDIMRPISKERAKSLLNLPQDKKIVLFVGRPDYSKGYDIVEKIAQINENILFLCILYPKIKSKRKNIITIQAVTRKNLYKYYSAADILLYPSRFDGFGYVPLEALACNTPVIANKVGILATENIEGCDIVKNNNDINEFSSLLKKDYNRINSRKLIKKKFSFARFGKEYKNLVESL